ncbi:HNH endonuclease [Sphingomonas sp. RS6]
MTSPRAWSFLAIDGARQYGGNAGYEDTPSTVYRYDSDVPNHLNVRPGDVAIIRSRAAVLGIATVENVIEATGPKSRQRCSECGTATIKSRAARTPRWRCREGHLFDEPVEEIVQVTTFEAHYGGTFKPCSNAMTLALLDGAVMRPSTQMSIKEIDLAQLEPVLLSNGITADFVQNYIRRLSPEDTDAGGNEAAHSIIEERRRVLREIALRRGQARFRQRLIDRYGACCQVSGCAFPGLIEAAHISPYARSNDNSERNGLLLRSDLHTLFDLGLLGIDPKSLRTAVNPQARAAGYEQFDGVAIHLNGSTGPERSALEERWLLYVEQLPPSDFDEFAGSGGAGA